MREMLIDINHTFHVQHCLIHQINIVASSHKSIHSEKRFLPDLSSLFVGSQHEKQST